VAVIECEPTASDEVVNVALPALKVTGAPRAVAPSRKVTVPVRVPAVVLVTFAVNVTDWLELIVAAEVLSAVVVVASGFTVSVTTEEVLGLKVASPE
jgi:hypothetical protein